MKPRVQSSILLLITLAIGILLGALIQSNIRGNRMRHFGSLRTEETFISQLEQAIDPTSEEQAAEVRAILVEVTPQIIGPIQEHREWARVQFEALEERLRPLLDEDQQERLKRRLHPPKFKPGGEKR